MVLRNATILKKFVFISPSWLLKLRTVQFAPIGAFRPYVKCSLTGDLKQWEMLNCCLRRWSRSQTGVPANYSALTGNSWHFIEVVVYGGFLCMVVFCENFCGVYLVTRVTLVLTYSHYCCL